VRTSQVSVSEQWA